MRPFRLSHRSMLRGAAGVAIALPGFEAMAPERSSLAAPAPPRRFLSVYPPGGTILERWTPTGTEASFTVSPILTPLTRLKDRLLVLSGIDMKSATGGGGPYACGMVAWLTGTEQKGLYSSDERRGTRGARTCDAPDRSRVSAETTTAALLGSMSSRRRLRGVANSYPRVGFFFRIFRVSCGFGPGGCGFRLADTTKAHNLRGV